MTYPSDLQERLDRYKIKWVWLLLFISLVCPVIGCCFFVAAWKCPAVALWEENFVY